MNQVEQAASDARFYYLALLGALAVPDMCGALESQDGLATGAKYQGWVDTHVAPLHTQPWAGNQPFLSGEDCYMFRCSFLHQGRTQHPRSGYSRILFIEPGAPSPFRGHMNILNDALHIDIYSFCIEMVGAARSWLAGVVGTEPYESNFAAFVHRYPTGLAPYIVGIPVIS